MAARRLIIVLVVLFAISIGAAAIAPQRDSPFTDDESSTTTTTTTTDEPEDAGEPDPAEGGPLMAEIIASAEKPETARAGIGDQVQLNVAVEGGGQVEIPPLGLLDTAGPAAPATFDLLLREAGALPITDAETGDLIGRLLVEERAGEAAAANRSPDEKPTNDAGKPGDGKHPGNG